MPELTDAQLIECYRQVQVLRQRANADRRAAAIKLAQLDDRTVELGKELIQRGYMITVRLL